MWINYSGYLWDSRKLFFSQDLWELLCAVCRHSAGLHARVILLGEAARRVGMVMHAT